MAWMNCFAVILYFNTRTTENRHKAYLIGISRFEFNTIWITKSTKWREYEGYMVGEYIRNCARVWHRIRVIWMALSSMENFGVSINANFKNTCVMFAYARLLWKILKTYRLPHEKQKVVKITILENSYFIMLPISKAKLKANFEFLNFKPWSSPKRLVWVRVLQSRYYKIWLTTEMFCKSICEKRRKTKNNYACHSKELI